MCGRFALHSNPELIKLQFELEAIPDIPARYNIAPDAPVLIVTESGAALARWRFKGRTHNARSDSLKKNLFRNAKRCLMPANGFYEWQRRASGSQPYYIRPARGELFAFAAIADEETCAVVTTDANRALGRIHDRMPAIVERADYARWLGGDDGMLGPAPEDAVLAHPVSQAVNVAANDSAALIRPVEPRVRDLFED
jgi:putative SOS response-associated peptidase YedK